MCGFVTQIGFGSANIAWNCFEEKWGEKSSSTFVSDCGSQWAALCHPTQIPLVWKSKILFRFKTYLCPKHTPGGRLLAGSSLLVMVNPSLLRRRDGQSSCAAEKPSHHWWWPLPKQTLNSRLTWGRRVLATRRLARARAQGNEISFICMFKSKIITGSG